jgi:ribosomal protein L20
LYRIAQVRGSGPAELLSSITTELKETLKLFLDFLDHRTIANLIASFGEIDILIYFSILIGDFGFAITHFLRTGEFRRALELLSGLDQNEEHLFYMHSPLLVTKLPAQTVDLWIKFRFLKPKKLFPSLVRYNEKVSLLIQSQQKGKQQQQQQQQHFQPLSEEQIRNMKPMEQYQYFEQLKQRQRGMSDAWVNPETELRSNQCLRYLRFCVNNLKNTDVAVHNFLLATLAQQDDEKMLIEFINSNDSFCDLKYALRLCTKLKKKITCVHIYTKMGLYEEAVDLALQMGDLSLAKLPANRPDEFLLKKKLWQRIAQTVIVEKKDVQSVMMFFKECKVLKIEDILPFFPDTVIIKQFKEEILEGLRAYNRDIETLNLRMLSSEKTSVVVRKEVLELKNRFIIFC